MPNNTIIIASLFAASVFASYYFQTIFNKDEIKFLMYAAAFLLSLGILTLIATRLIGDLGLLVLAAACCMHSGQALLYAFFWLSRLLIQAFVMSNVANVTGINLMHPYCSAALYLGFLAIVFISVLLHISNYKTINLIACLLLSLALPAALIYLIHEEAISSFLLAANVAAISLVTFSPMFFKKPSDDYQLDLAALPVLLATSSLLSAPLVELGNHATVVLRFQIALYALIGLILISFALSKVRRLSGNPV